MNKPTKEYSAMLYALAKEMRDEEGCVTESDQLVEQAAERLDSQTVEITVLKKQRDELLVALGVAQAAINCAAIDTPSIVARTVEKYADEIASVKGGGA